METTAGTHAEKSEPSERARRSVNKSSLTTKDVIQHVDKLLKMCRAGGNACVPGPSGPPGGPGAKGQKGSRGRRSRGQKGRQGAVGPQGIMGTPGSSGKRGIMGESGPKGEKGDMGDAGSHGMPGLKGEPGESISAPHVIVSPSSVTTNKSMTVNLPCSATGNPRPLIKWTKEGSSLPSNRTSVTDLGELFIKNVGLQDSGRYKCSARNILGTDKGFVDLSVQARPQIILKAGPTYVADNSNLTLPRCHVTGFPTPKITWSKHFGRLPTLSIVQEGQLKLFNTAKQDSGLYECQATNSLASDSATTNLVVVSLHFTSKPPGVLSVTTGATLFVPCSATGDIKPVVTWSKSIGELPAGRSQVLSNGILKLTNIQKGDVGRYVCTASIGKFKLYAGMQLYPMPACEPVGVKDQNQIPDSSMTASSYYSAGYSPHYGRLYATRGSHGDWCPRTRHNITDYLQIDLGARHTLCGVATQGAHSHNEWTTRYKLSVSLDNVNWHFYQENNSIKEFPGNSDSNSVVKNQMENMDGRYVRFYPLARNHWPCLRVEVFALL